MAGPAPDGGAEREDERALAQTEAAGGERDEDAEQPGQRESAQEQEGVEAGGRPERPRERPGAQAGGDPARRVEGDHQRQRAPAQRPGGLDPAGLQPVVQPAADEARARRHRGHERGGEERDGQQRWMDSGAQEAGHGGHCACDDHGELLVAGHGHDLRRRGADALARRDAVGEADDAAGLVAQQERARPHARQRAGRPARADAPQPECEGQGLQQRRDGEERDGEREQPVVDRPVERRDGLALRPAGPGEAEDGADGEQWAQAARDPGSHAPRYTLADRRLARKCEVARRRSAAVAGRRCLRIRHHRGEAALGRRDRGPVVLLGVSYPGGCWIVGLLAPKVSTVVDGCCPATPIDHASAATAPPSAAWGLFPSVML